jgi:hypothetical protein
MKVYTTEVMNKINFRAITIQRLGRGYIGRGKARRRRLLVLRNRAALIIQCFWRGHLAMVRFIGIRSERKRQSAALAIQKMIRGVILRKHLKYQKLINEAADRIIYSWFRYVAMKERSKMIRWRMTLLVDSILLETMEVIDKKVKSQLKSAILIQKCIRGKFGRTRFMFHDSIRRKNREVLIV